MFSESIRAFIKSKKHRHKWVRFVTFFYSDRIALERREIALSWSLAIDQDSGCILRSFKRNLSTNQSLTPASINHVLKSLQKQAGLNQIGELSGHSFRVGAALDLLDKNIPLEKIIHRGGWKSETSAMRYLQSWSDQDWLIVTNHHN